MHFSKELISPILHVIGLLWIGPESACSRQAGLHGLCLGSLIGNATPGLITTPNLDLSRYGVFGRRVDGF